MTELRVKADDSELDNVLDFIDALLEKAECPSKVMIQMNIAVEELFVNIAHYAYSPGTGDAVIKAEVEGVSPEAFVRITFIDSGMQYDPLAKKDPDITLSADERPIGGLGVYMVKKSMDDVSYEYREGQNVLSIFKRF